MSTNESMCLYVNTSLEEFAIQFEQHFPYPFDLKSKDEKYRLEFGYDYENGSLSIFKPNHIGKAAIKLEQKFGFVSNVCLSFLPHKTYEASRLRDYMRKDIISLSLKLIKTYQYSLLVAFQDYEFIVMVYANDQLTLNDLDGIWTPERLIFVDIPYEMSPLDYT